MVGVCTPWCTCRNQRTASSIECRFSNFTLFETGSLAFCWNARLADPWASVYSPVSASMLWQGMLGKTFVSVSLCEFWGSEIRSSGLCRGAWLTEPFSQPLNFIFNWCVRHKIIHINGVLCEASRHVYHMQYLYKLSLAPQYLLIHYSKDAQAPFFRVLVIYSSQSLQQLCHCAAAH